MTSKQIQLTLGLVTIAALVGVVILLALGRPVPSELYAFLGLGFGGHLALANPPTVTGPGAAQQVVLEEAAKALQAVTAAATPARPVSAAQTAQSAPATPSVTLTAPAAPPAPEIAPQPAPAAVPPAA